MDKVLPTIKERILLLADIKGIAKGKFLSDAGLNYNNFKGPAKNTHLLSDAVASLLNTYPDINPYWLLLGKGDILIATQNEEESVVVYNEDMNSNTDVNVNQVIPLFDIQSVASLSSVFSRLISPVDYVCVPNLPNIDGAITMRGETMVPEVRSGDILLYRQVKDHTKRDNIFFGQMYLLSFIRDDQEQITIKYIYEAEDSDYLRLVNKNSYYASIDIPFESIQAIAMIKACLHYFEI